MSAVWRIAVVFGLRSYVGFGSVTDNRKIQRRLVSRVLGLPQLIISGYLLPAECSAVWAYIPLTEFSEVLAYNPILDVVTVFGNIKKFAASRRSPDSRYALTKVGMFLRRSARDSASISGLSGSCRKRQISSAKAIRGSSRFGGRKRLKSVPGG